MVLSSSLSGKPTIPAAPALEDNSGTPALATGITAAEVRTAIGAIDDYTVTQSDVTAHKLHYLSPSLRSVICKVI